jgi:predicted aspartyl protease
MKTERLWFKRFVWLASVAMIFASLEGLSSAEGSQAVGATRPILSGTREGDGEVPFTLQDGYLIVVEARIGGRRRMKFALDTGATHSVLRAELAKGLELASRPVRIVNLDHVSTQEMVEVKDFQLGPIRIA